MASTDVVKGPSGGAVLEELMQMLCDLWIAQARRDIGEHSWDRRPSAGFWCMWCDAVGHIRRECADFTETLRNKVVYLSNGRVHACETWKPVDYNTERGGMKRLIEEAVA